MRVLIPILGFDRTGGYRVLSELANHWVSAGHRVDFLVPVLSAPPYFQTRAGILWVDRSGALGGPPGKPPGQVWDGVYNLIALYRGLGACGKDYEIILANHSLTAWPVRWANCGSARKFYYIQAYEPEYYLLERKYSLWALSKLSYSLGLRSIVNAPIYRNYRNIRADNMIPPGVDLSCFYAKTERKDLAFASEIVLGCIGRKEPIKGTRYVLTAFAALWERDKRFRLRVAYGNLPEGWTHPACEVVVPGNDSELAEFYRSVDIMIAPGTGQHGAAHYPVMEAMACGVPVVTTGYMPANLENSWIVKSGSAGAIAAAVYEIISDANYERKVGYASGDIVRFEWGHVAQEMMGLLSSAA